MPGTDSSDRHLETAAVLDVIASATLVGLAGWLVGGLRESVNAEERQLRLELARVIGGAGLIFFVLWASLELRTRVGRILHLLVAYPLLLILPLGTVWGGYLLWALGKADARNHFGRPLAPSGRPYWGAILVAASLSAGLATAGATLARRTWLEGQVSAASARAGLQQETISRRMQQLRQNGVFDAEQPSARRIRR